MQVVRADVLSTFVQYRTPDGRSRTAYRAEGPVPLLPAEFDRLERLGAVRRAAVRAGVKPGRRKAGPTRVWFVTPAHGRVELADVCFEQRARMLASLNAGGMAAGCVVVADDENLALAERHGLDTLRAANTLLGRKFNDGIEYACEKGADLVCTIGSDDWAHPSLVVGLTHRLRDVSCVRACAVVGPAGDSLGVLKVDYDGGIGARVFPVGMLAPFGYRPAREQANRAIDTSILLNLSTVGEVPLTYRPDESYWAVVDFKRGDRTLNPYRTFGADLRSETPDPWGQLAGWYPKDLVGRMRDLYQERRP